MSAAKCHRCGAELSYAVGSDPGRSAECDGCRTDARVCLNCLHYDKSAYNECREPQAERVVDKDRRNFCDYFSLRAADGSTVKSAPSKDDILKKLDDLFKK